MQSVVRGVVGWVMGLERGPDDKEGGPRQEGGRRRTRWAHPLPTWPVSPALVAKGSPRWGHHASWVARASLCARLSPQRND